jgi:hypothetical protein
VVKGEQRLGASSQDVRMWLESAGKMSGLSVVPLQRNGAVSAALACGSRIMGLLRRHLQDNSERRGRLRRDDKERRGRCHQER